ncbi:hypothetical protein BGZ83_006464 [Gryganskiella cystojenkinii]|nr:hypothetical protein BGZ83_006464 [Gryganskiella cystojenkinii]
MSGTTPAHRLINENGTKGITIDNWTVLSHKTSILSSSEIDAASADLGIPIPEMIFGNNYLSIEHKNSGFKLEFRALPALAMVDQSSTSSDHIKVSYAREWFDKRSMANQEHITDVVKPYDWTYSTRYMGSNASSDLSLEFGPTEETIDIEQLKRPDPILFYDENILFEDELADNGTAVLTTKMRVMPSCFFILLRFFLRVDDVLFRVYDTRIYHRFGTSTVLRECSTREASYREIRSRIPRSKGEDLSLLLDSNWVSSQLPEQDSGVAAVKLTHE